MNSSSRQLRTIAFAMVVLGFLAELAGIGLLASGRRAPASLAVMIAGLLLVMTAVVLLTVSRR